MSSSHVTSQRPTLHWQLATGSDGAHVQLCHDRACTSIITEFDAAGMQGAPASNLPPGVVFWRMAGRAGGATGSLWSPVWEMWVGAENNPLSLAWGSVLDVDGDGHADLAVGSPWGARTVQVFLGSGTGLGSVASATLNEPAPGTHPFGSIVSSAGDVNGDGFCDLIVGSNTGPAYLFFGSATGVHATPDQTIDIGGMSASVSAGAGGDVDGDGYGEVVVDTFVMRGGPTGVDTAHLRGIPQLAPGSGMGVYLGYGGGDLNGDGFADLTLCTGQSATVAFGGPDLVSMTRGVGLLPPTSGEDFGRLAVVVGDVNGDAYSDLIVASANYVAGTGRAYLYLGAPGTLFPTSPSVVLSAPEGMEQFGSSVSTLGDPNGDGFDEYVIGAQTYGGSTGRAYLYRGGATPTTTWALLAAPMFNGGFACALSGGRDLTGDGVVDLAVGARYESSVAGTVYVFSGVAATLVSPTPASPMLHGAAGDQFGLGLQ
jgi:hypothetical protein